MAEKIFKWRKLGRDLLMDERTLRLSTLALHLRLVFEIAGQPDDEQRVAGQLAPGVGWMLDEYGDAYDEQQLAALVHIHGPDAEAVIADALAQLKKARIIVRSDGGVWGAVDHEERQLDPTTKRTRAFRSRQAADPGTPAPGAGNAPGTLGNDQREEDRGQRTEVSPPPSAGGREEIPPPTGTTPAPPTTLGQRLALARESAATPLSAASVARLSRIHRTRYDQLEADEALPDRDELRRIAATLARPDIAAWDLPERDLELVAAVVRQHRDLAVELGAMDPGDRREPLVVTAQDVAAVYATEPRDTAQGLSLADAWRRAIARGAEDLRRDIARGKPDQRLWFTLAALAGGKRRAHLLAALDLDRRDDGQGARASPRRRGPAPPQNPDRLTDGEIPQ